LPGSFGLCCVSMVLFFYALNLLIGFFALRDETSSLLTIAAR